MLSQIFEFFRKLLDSGDWPPRWYCGTWSTFHGWLYLLSDLLVASAYFAIPIIIIRYMRRKELQFPRLYMLFAAFILACGLTHLIDAAMFYWPVYRLSALVRFGTGVVSWATALSLVQLMPVAFSLRSHKELEKEIDHRIAAEQALREKNDRLNEAQRLSRIGNWERVYREGVAYVTGSPMFFEIFGFGTDYRPVLYEMLIQRIHPDDREYVRDNSGRANSEGNIPAFFYRVVHPDGKILQVMASGHPVYDDKGNLVKVVGIIQDVTQLKSMEAELLQKTVELESRVNDLQRFAFIASHDLKEPLRKIGMFASLLETQYGHSLEEKGVEYVQKIRESIHRNQQLVDELLLFSRLGNERLDYKSCQLDTLAEEALSELEVLREEANAEVVIDPLPEAEVSPTQFILLFQNLLANALKFRKPDAPCKIHIFGELIAPGSPPMARSISHQFSVMGNPRYWEREQFCKITVKDNGIGFEKENREVIFEIFRRAHAQYPGTGLGLAICKKIVENHSGTIVADGAPGEGATFIILIPIAQHAFR